MISVGSNPVLKRNGPSSQAHFLGPRPSAQWIGLPIMVDGVNVVEVGKAIPPRRRWLEHVVFHSKRIDHREERLAQVFDSIEAYFVEAETKDVEWKGETVDSRRGEGGRVWALVGRARIRLEMVLVVEDLDLGEG